LWKERLKGEEEGVETMQGINRVLLENLLPAHVARHLLTVLKVMMLFAKTFQIYFLMFIASLTS
jgi:adenylate cyclase 2